MFFNIAHQKSVRPGRSGDVNGQGLGRGCISPQPRYKYSIVHYRESVGE